MLSVKDKMTLDLERRWWKFPAAKEAAIRDLFSESSVRYYQRLNALIDRPEAMEYDAALVRRLQRLRARRQAVRSAAVVGFDL
jgi:hypothetical protein